MRARTVCSMHPTSAAHTLSPRPVEAGSAIVVVTTLASGFLAAFGLVDLNLLIALSGGGVAIAVAGFVDDRASLPAGVRLVIHLAAACWAAFWLGRVAGPRTWGSLSRYRLGGVRSLPSSRLRGPIGSL